MFLAQTKNETNPNGYNKFYYENGILSSEGYMKDGKADGYWKNYYENGKIKNEGNRKNFQLDSLWKFYNEKGKLTKTFYYKDISARTIGPTLREIETSQNIQLCSYDSKKFQKICFAKKIFKNAP